MEGGACRRVLKPDERCPIASCPFSVDLAWCDDVPAFRFGRKSEGFLAKMVRKSAVPRKDKALGPKRTGPPIIFGILDSRLLAHNASAPLLSKGAPASA